MDRNNSKNSLLSDVNAGAKTGAAIGRYMTGIVGAATGGLIGAAVGGLYGIVIKPLAGLNPLKKSISFAEDE